jgi:hypothetical protein
MEFCPTGEIMPTREDDTQLLRAFCQAENVGIRLRACEILNRHRWIEGEDRVIFEACETLIRFGVRISPAALAVQLTRAGFPDVDLDPLFEPLPRAATVLAGRLKAMERGGQ